MVNFTACAAAFSDSLPTLTLSQSPALVTWVGIPGTPNSSDWAVTRAGCNKLCTGSSPEFYTWTRSSATITTWILPIIGVLLQAPFEANATWRTIKIIFRWVGSPIVSLSCILWNIRVLGTCCLLVDLATTRDEPRIPPQIDESSRLPLASPLSDVDSMDHDFYQMRDSLFILGVMNQYTITRFHYNDGRSADKAAQGLLRIVLFSKKLPLEPLCHLRGCRCLESTQTLQNARSQLAELLRKKRKKGIVPVFVSTGWFLFALIISIQAAFGQVGESHTAHDLALGLLLGWLPVLVLASIVDRNSTDPEGNEKELNKLIYSVARSIAHPQLYKEYKDYLVHQSKVLGLDVTQSESENGLEAIRLLCEQRTKSINHFFHGFAGQGRIRWHYGCAHTILSDIEEHYINKRGKSARSARGWLFENESDTKARVHLVVDGMKSKSALLWFDYRGVWQVLFAILIVCCTCFGAFILSYQTPTIGLGCRSAGYMIYVSIAFALLLAEFSIWAVDSLLPDNPAQQAHAASDMEEVGTAASHTVDPSPPTEHTTETSPISQETSLVHSPAKEIGHLFADIKQEWRTSASFLASGVEKEERASDDDPDSKEPKHVEWQHVDHPSDNHSPKAHAPVLARSRTRRSMRAVDVFLTAGEGVNTAWLLYIIIAQTFGIYQTCSCKTSYWGLGRRGFLDFRLESQAPPQIVQSSWITGTALGLAPLAAGYTYIVAEWLLQSHLSTLDEHNAIHGLRRVRRWRLRTWPVRVVTQVLVDGAHDLARWALLQKRWGSRKRKAVRWVP